MAEKEPTTKPSPTARRTPARPVRAAEKDYEGTPLSMTGIRSSLMHSMFMKVVLGVLILIFAASFLFTSSMPGGGPAGGGNGPDPVASVNGANISRDSLYQALNNMMQQYSQFGQNTGPVELLSMKLNALNSLAEQAALAQAAEAAGITVSDEEVDKEIDKQLDEALKQQKGDDEANFRRQIEAKYPGGEPEYVAELRKSVDREAVRKTVLLKKYDEHIKAEATKDLTEDDYKRSITKLNLRQIIIRPAIPAPTEKDFKAAQEKNGADAKAKADKLAEQLKGKTGSALTAAFDALAKKESMDSPTKAKGGVLGWKLPSELLIDKPLQTALQDATGNLVGPLQTEGTQDVYLFLIEGRKVDLPKDYEKNKKKLIEDFKTQRGNDASTANQEKIRKELKPDIHDPALIAYKAQTQDIYAAPAAEQKGLREAAIAEYEEALKYSVPLEQSAIRYQMAQLYSQLNQPAKQVEVLQAAIRDSPDVPALRIELAKALRADKKTKEAKDELAAASKALTEHPSPPSMFGGNPDDQIRLQIAAEYEQMGDKRAAEAERKLIKPPTGGMGGMGGFGGGSPIQINPGR